VQRKSAIAREGLEFIHYMLTLEYRAKRQVQNVGDGARQVMRSGVNVCKMVADMRPNIECGTKSLHCL